jgi:hypothetical protein
MAVPSPANLTAVRKGTVNMHPSQELVQPIVRMHEGTNEFSSSIIVQVHMCMLR